MLGGTKHFGYYPPGAGISMKQSMRNMEQQMGLALNLKPGAKVLDAGCGEGFVARYLSKHFSLEVEGVDILDFNIARAKRRSQGMDRVRFKLMDYAKLSYTNGSFDGLYTMETLVHAPDFTAALREFHRVLKPGGRLVLFEYSLPPQKQLAPHKREIFRQIIEGSGMWSLPYFEHGSFPAHLAAAGFSDIKVKDITARMLPMAKRFHQLAWLPYQLVKLLGSQKHFTNTLSGVELWRHRKDFRYNIITARKG